MKYLILLLLISNVSFAENKTCSTLFATYKPTETDIDSAISELHELRTKFYSTSLSERTIAHSLFRKKEQELLEYISPSEISKRMRALTITKERELNKTEPTLTQMVPSVLKFIFENNLSINQTDAEGNTLLHIAAQKNRLDLIEPLIKIGIDPNTPNREHETALHFATTDKTIKELLKNGANIEATTTNGYTPLLRMAYEKELLALDTLLKMGANPDPKTGSDRTLMSVATNFIHDFRLKSKTIAMVNFLISRGFTFDMRGPYKDEYLKFAIENNYTKAVEEYLQINGANARFIINQNALHVAGIYSNQQIFDILLKAGVDKDFYDALGRTPLHVAANSGNEAGVIALINAGADINARDDNSKSALQMARVHPKIVDILRKHGAK